jgi:TM2 domain-containing membrane protein YozV
MTTQAQVSTAPAARSASMAYMALIAGWLVPGAGHFLLRKPIRGALLFVCVVSMFAIGCAMQGKIYNPNTGDLLDILNFAGQLGSGILYFLARAFGWGAPSVVLATADYGTKFIVVSGLLNVVAAVDAHSIAIGRKAS